MMRLALLTLLSLLLWGQAIGQSVQPTKIRVRGVDLHYIEQGQGESLILLHGGQGDYRSWESLIKVLSPQYRVISYSRRFNYPNNNPITAKYHSAYTEADDLAAFIRKLKLGRVHLVGTSIGAFTALALAVKHPEMVRSLVLAEPPVHQWVRDTPEGAAVYRDFMTTIQEPARAAFKAGDDKGAMRFFVNGIVGTGRFDNLTPEGLAAVMQNSRFFRANTLSSDPYPNLSKEKVKRLRIPILIITGENTIRIHRLVNEELARLQPRAERVLIPKAGHTSSRDNPQAFNEAVLKFLANHTKTAVAQLEPACVKDSPERRGEIGCSIVEDKPLPETLKEPLFWHIDRFDSGERARAAAGPASVAFEAHGTWWLMTIEARVDDHHSGRHVTQVKLPPLPQAPKYSMLVISAYIPAGLTSRVHQHSGVEAFYVVDGAQCLETPGRAYRMKKGGTLVIPAGVTMRLVATGSTPRRGLAVIVYDSAQPPTTRMEMEKAPQLVSCR